MKYLTHKNKAFTLIELLTVIAIIGILAAIIIPTVGSVRVSAKKAKAKTQFSQIIQAYELFKQEYGFYPDLDSATARNYKKLATEADTELLAGALTGKKPNGDPQTTAASLCGNRKKLSFYSFATDDFPKVDDQYVYKLQDAFGNTEIFIMCDANGDGIIKSGTTDDGATVAVAGKDGGTFAAPAIPTGGIRASIIIYSAGDKGKGVKSWE